MIIASPAATKKSPKMPCPFSKARIWCRRNRWTIRREITVPQNHQRPQYLRQKRINPANTNVDTSMVRPQSGRKWLAVTAITMQKKPSTRSNKRSPRELLSTAIECDLAIASLHTRSTHAWSAGRVSSNVRKRTIRRLGNHGHHSSFTFSPETLSFSGNIRRWISSITP